MLKSKKKNIVNTNKSKKFMYGGAGEIKNTQILNRLKSLENTTKKLNKGQKELKKDKLEIRQQPIKKEKSKLTKVKEIGEKIMPVFKKLDAECRIEDLIFNERNYDKSDLDKIINKKKIFNDPKNEFFIKRYIKPFILKYCGIPKKPIQANINYSCIILNCIPDKKKKIYLFLYHIFDKLKYIDEFKNKYEEFRKKNDKDFDAKLSGKNTQEKDKYITEQLKYHYESKKKEFNFKTKDKKYKGLYEIVADFLINVFCKAYISYKAYMKLKNIKAVIDYPEIEILLKEIDIKKEIKKKINKIEIKKIKIDKYKKTETFSIVQEERSQLNELYVELKKYIIELLQNEATKKYIKNKYKEGYLQEDKEMDKAMSYFFDKNRSSKYMFFVLGLFSLAILLKLNLLESPPGLGMGAA